MDSIESLKETFFQECEEQLADLETCLLAMNDGSSDSETVNAAFRAVHSIKGGAGAFKFSDLVQFSHKFENCLDLLRTNQLQVSDGLLKVMLKAADLLSDLVAAARSVGSVDQARIEAAISELESCYGAKDETQQSIAVGVEDEFVEFTPVTLSFDFGAETEDCGKPSSGNYKIVFRPHDRLYKNGNEPTRLLQELHRLGDVETVCDASSIPLLDALGPDDAGLTWTINLATQASEQDVRDVFEFVEGDCDLDIDQDPLACAAVDADDLMRFEAPKNEEARLEQAASGDAEMKSFTSMAQPEEIASPEKPVGPEEGAIKSRGEGGKFEVKSSTIRVDLERVDRLMNLVGEMVINQAMLSQSITEAGLSRSSSIVGRLGALEQLTREIQEGVMAIRAQPVKPLFQRMARIVREVAEITGKTVTLKTEGENTEIDRTVIERIADPLTHMIRNAVDHGLEKPSERLAAGKPPQGEITLSAVHRSGRIVIDVTDDGGGINRPRVKEIAIRKGLIASDVQLTDSEIDNLLFLPGFSTAESISSVSGRGVGMDVVKQSIQGLGGRISVSSNPGEGSRFSMSLPLTLAVLDGMIVKVADQTLVVPLTAVVETMRPKKSDIHEFGSNGKIIRDRGCFVPLIDLGQELGYREKPADSSTGVILTVETEVSTRCALVVDEICDQRQVVIKSLEANYRRVPGIAAATILGDGRVALILDIDSFVTRSNRKPPMLTETSLALAG